jgi:hypothetical protein
VKPATSAPHEGNMAPSHEVLFAVCEDLNEQVILTADMFRQLELLKTYNVMHIPELITAKSQVERVGDASDSSEIDDILPLDDRAETLIPCDTDVSNDSEGGSASIVDDSPSYVKSVSADGDLRCADAITLRNEQLADTAVAKYWNFSREEKCGFFLKDGLLYRHGKVNGKKVIQLCLPETRIDTVLKLAHDMPFSGHMAFRRTDDLVSLNVFFPGQRARVKDYCMQCEKCQLFAPARRDDLNVIEPIPRNAQPFGHLVFDCVGPFGDTGRHKYAFVITDLNTRFPMAHALTNISTKKICDCLSNFFSIFSMPSVVHCDMGTNFTSNLTKLLLTRLGCVLRFISSYHPQSTGLVGRTNVSLKTIISKLATSFPHSWETILPFALWSLRTYVNETLGISPYRAAFGRSPVGPLQILCDSWTGQRDLPLDLAKHPREYLRQVEENLRIGQDYASQHAEKAQRRYANYYNAKSSDKKVDVGEQVIYLVRSSNQKMFSHWLGSCRVIRQKSPHSYVIEVNGVQRNVHVNHLRKFHPSVTETQVNNCAIVFDSDVDFGGVAALDVEQLSADQVDGSANVETGGHNDLTPLPNGKPSSCDIILPSSLISQSQLSHLTPVRQKNLLNLLGLFSDCFSEKPGLCTYVEHRIRISSDFKPLRLREYRVPELLKDEVRRQIDGLIKDGFIVPSNSPMASPFVCVLKWRDGKSGVRLAIDYKYVNRFTVNDAYVMPNISDILQKVGCSKFITSLDCSRGYWQLLLNTADRWLTAFAYDGGFWEWTRLPFGLRTSGNSFVRCVQRIVFLSSMTYLFVRIRGRIICDTYVHFFAKFVRVDPL